MNQEITVHTDFEQGTHEWHKIRMGKVGGTRSSTLFTLPSKKDASEGAILGKGAIDLAYKIASDQLGLHLRDNPYKLMTPPTVAMERGNLLEPFARDEYIENTKNKVVEVGYVSHNLFSTVGFSPDGIIYEGGIISGLLEIKCPMGPEFLRVLATGDIKKEYLHQMQWGMWVTGASWCDHYTFFDESDEHSRIRVERDEEMMSRLDIAVPEFQRLVEQAVEAGGGI